MNLLLTWNLTMIVFLAIKPIALQLKIILIHLFCFIDKTATQQRIDMLWHEQQQCTFHFYIIWYLEFGFCTTYMENYVDRDKKESILIIRWMKCWLTLVMRVSFQWKTEMRIVFQTHYSTFRKSLLRKGWSVIHILIVVDHLTRNIYMLYS